MNKKLLLALMAFSFASSVVLSSCKKDKEDDEEELITTLKVTATPVGGGTTVTASFKDVDGGGGNAPSLFETLSLAPNKTYNCAIQVLNESVSPVDDITTEIRNEANDHQFYITSSIANATIGSLDNDALGLPLGLAFNITTTASNNGKLQIVLKHKPGIKAAGDLVSKGETDIELPDGGFNLRVQ